MAVGLLLFVVLVGAGQAVLEFAVQRPIAHSSPYASGLQSGLRALLGAGLVYGSARAGKALGNGLPTRLHGFLAATIFSAVAIFLFRGWATLPAILDPTLRWTPVQDHSPFYRGDGSTSVIVAGVVIFWLPSALAARMAKTSETLSEEARRGQQSAEPAPSPVREP